jgi:hypothetical protein
MGNSWESFSKRFGHTGDKKITILEDAPGGLRFAALNEAITDYGMTAEQLRTIVCDVLREFPDPNNWGAEYILREVKQYVNDCEWFRVYDIIEAIYANHPDPHLYQSAINECFREMGIGWQL